MRIDKIIIILLIAIFVTQPLITLASNKPLHLFNSNFHTREFVPNSLHTWGFKVSVNQMIARGDVDTPTESDLLRNLQTIYGALRNDPTILNLSPSTNFLEIAQKTSRDIVNNLYRYQIPSTTNGELFFILNSSTHETDKFFYNRYASNSRLSSTDVSANPTNRHLNIQPMTNIPKITGQYKDISDTVANKLHTEVNWGNNFNFSTDLGSAKTFYETWIKNLSNESLHRMLDAKRLASGEGIPTSSLDVKLYKWFHNFRFDNRLGITSNTLNETPIWNSPTGQQYSFKPAEATNLVRVLFDGVTDFNFSSKIEQNFSVLMGSSLEQVVESIYNISTNSAKIIDYRRVYEYFTNYIGLMTDLMHAGRAYEWAMAGIIQDMLTTIINITYSQNVLYTNETSSKSIDRFIANQSSLPFIVVEPVVAVTAENKHNVVSTINDWYIDLNNNNPIKSPPLNSFTQWFMHSYGNFDRDTSFSHSLEVITKYGFQGQRLDLFDLFKPSVQGFTNEDIRGHFILGYPILPLEMVEKTQNESVTPDLYLRWFINNFNNNTNPIVLNNNLDYISMQFELGDGNEENYWESEFSELNKYHDGNPVQLYGTLKLNGIPISDFNNLLISEYSSPTDFAKTVFPSSPLPNPKEPTHSGDITKPLDIPNYGTLVNIDLSHIDFAELTELDWNNSLYTQETRPNSSLLWLVKDMELRFEANFYLRVGIDGNDDYFNSYKEKMGNKNYVDIYSAYQNDRRGSLEHNKTELSDVTPLPHENALYIKQSDGTTVSTLNTQFNKHQQDITEIRSKPQQSQIFRRELSREKTISDPIRLLSDPPIVFAEIREGSILHENFEVLSGVPSTQRLFVTIGGSTFIYDIHVRWISNYSEASSFSTGNFEGWSGGADLGLPDNPDKYIAIARNYGISFDTVICHTGHLHTDFIKKCKSQNEVLCKDGTIICPGHTYIIEVEVELEDGSIEKQEQEKPDYCSTQQGIACLSSGKYEDCKTIPACGSGEPCWTYIQDPHFHSWSKSWKHYLVGAQYFSIEQIYVWRIEEGFVNGTHKVLVEENFAGGKDDVNLSAELLFRNSPNNMNTPLEVIDKVPIDYVKVDNIVNKPEIFWNVAKDVSVSEARVFWTLEPFAKNGINWNYGESHNICSEAKSGPPCGHFPFIQESIDKNDPTHWVNVNNNKVTGLMEQFISGNVKTDALVISDTLILRTYSGDFPVFYFEQPSISGAKPIVSVVSSPKSPTDNTEYRENLVEWSRTQNSSNLSVKSEPIIMKQFTMKEALAEATKFSKVPIGSYNGLPQSTSNRPNDLSALRNKYGDIEVTTWDFDENSIFGSNLENRGLYLKAPSQGFIINLPPYSSYWGTSKSQMSGTVNQGGTVNQNISSPISARIYVPKPSNNHIIFSDTYEINMRLENGLYEFGDTNILYPLILGFTKSGIGLLPIDYVSTDKGENRTVNNIDVFNNKYGYVAEKANFTRRGEVGINPIIIDTPVSSEFSFIFELPKERDQRLSPEEIKSYILTTYLGNSQPAMNDPVIPSYAIQLGNQQFVPASFLNLDWGFQMYFPTVGNFHQTDDWGITYHQSSKGYGYTDSMDTAWWIQSKYVIFDFDVIFSGKLFKAGERVTLFDRGYNYSDWNSSLLEIQVGTELRSIDSPEALLNSVWNFYIPLSQAERASSTVSYNVVAINKGSFGVPFNHNPNNRNRFIYNNSNQAVTESEVDIVGRIGNLVISDTQDPLFSNFFKDSLGDYSFDISGTGVSPQWLFENLIYKVNNNLPFNFVGDVIDIRGLPTDGTKINVWLDRIFNHSMYQEWLRDVGIEWAQNLFNLNFGLNTHGTFPYRETIEHLPLPLTASMNKWNPQAVSIQNPVHSTVLNNYEIGKGYDTFFNITTLGNYENILQINPLWFAVSKENIWTPVDIYAKVDDQYKIINRHSLFSHNADDNYDLYKNHVYSFPYILNFDSEWQRRNIYPQLSEWNNNRRTVSEMYTPLLQYLKVFGRPAETRDAVFIPNRGFQGMGVLAGNQQIVQLNLSNVLWSGSDNTLGVNMNPGSRNSIDDYILNSTTWFFNMGLPSSAIAIPSENNSDWKVKTPDINKQVDNTLVMLADILAVGKVWTLRYNGTSDFSLSEIIVDENVKIPLLPPELVTEINPPILTPIPGGNSGIYQGKWGTNQAPKRIPLIIIDRKRNSSDDLDIAGTH